LAIQDVGKNCKSLPRKKAKCPEDKVAITLMKLDTFFAPCQSTANTISV